LGGIFAEGRGKSAISGTYELADTIGRSTCSTVRITDAVLVFGADKSHALFLRQGSWLVALSHALPVLPEVIACLAGLTEMPARSFFVSLACGSVPLGFVYAGIGAAGVERPGLALALSAAIPVGLWLVARRIWRVGR
jgi:uncharacterized membrane protein YdjX (TVP38/TMEM64 family)